MRMTLNPQVLGSNPGGRTSKTTGSRLVAAHQRVYRPARWMLASAVHLLVHLFGTPHERGVAAVGVPSGECRRHAEVLVTPPAEPAGAAPVAEPPDTYPNRPRP